MKHILSLRHRPDTSTSHQRKEIICCMKEKVCRTLLTLQDGNYEEKRRKKKHNNKSNKTNEFFCVACAGAFRTSLSFNFILYNINCHILNEKKKNKLK